MTLHSSEPNRLPYWLRRLWPIYCFLAALVTFGYALYDPYQIDGDAVSYMDIGDLIRAHNWHAVINGYWNPLYPAALSLGHTLFHATRYTELHAYYMVNYGIFLLEMLAIIAFTSALIQLRDQRATAATSDAPSFLLDLYGLRYLGVGLLVIATQRELSLGKVRPDALLQAFLLFALAALVKHLTTHRLSYAALMGIALGLAYLTKSFAFLFTFLCILTLIVFRIFWQRSSPTRAAAAGILALLCFSLVAGPYIAALSHQKGRFDFGDSGNLNFAWFVSGTEKMHLQPEQTSSFGDAQVHLKHPEKELLQSPVVLSYKQLPYGTYPDWFDTSYWNDQVKPHMNPRLELRIIRDCIIRIFRYLANHPEACLLLLLLVLLGARLRAGDWRPSANAFWLPPIILGLAILGIYSIVNIEDRYITVGFLAIMLPLFAALRISPAAQSAARLAASTAALLLALLAIGESARNVGELRRSLPFKHYPAGWYDANIFQAAHGLNDLGIGPGDSIACAGTIACLYDPYWARLAGVRILTEIYEPDPPLYPSLAAMPNRDQVIDLVRHQGDKALIGYFSPGQMTGNNPVAAGWHQLGDSPFYALPFHPPAPPAQP
jgi:hypothetical protein